jgi:DNA-binding transcriptional regulator YdaS (Cro superfamily)
MDDREYRDALNRYARELLRLLQVLGVQQADVARRLGVSRTLVTLWLQGSKLLPAQHESAMRDLITQAVAAQRPALATVPLARVEAFWKDLVPVLVALDSAAVDLTLAYAESVRTVNRAAIAWIDETLGSQACSAETATALQEAYASAQHTLARLKPVLRTAKANNRGLKTLVTPPADVDLRTYLGEVLTYVAEVYGERAKTHKAATPPRRKGRRPAQARG